MTGPAISHVYTDLADVPARVVQFRSAPEPEQLIALAELHRRASVLEHPASTTAVAASIGSITALAGIVATFIIFQFQTLTGLATVSEEQALKYGDEGDVGRAQALFRNADQAIHDTNGVWIVIGFAVVVLAMCSTGIIWARRRSAARGIVAGWLVVFEGTEATQAPSAAASPGTSSESWLLPRPFRIVRLLSGSRSTRPTARSTTKPSSNA